MSAQKTSPAEPGNKIALLGASTLDGVRVREALEQARVPGRLVDLFDHSDEEMLLGEYAGEARVIQNPDVEEIAGHRVVLLCGAGPSVERLAARAGELLVIDVVGALPEGSAARLAGPAVGEGGDARGLLRVPHPLALVLADLLRPIDHGPGIEEVVAVVLRPAADYGQQGVDELRQQTVRLLNFVEMPVDTFGRQLAFNIVPELGLSCAVPGQEARISRQVAELLGWDRERLALRFLAAPLFFGHAVELRLRTGNGAGVEDIRDALRNGGLDPEAGAGPRISTPMDVADERELRVGDLTPDGLGGFWLWAVAGRSGTRAAEIAVGLARRALGI
jgi:aspartate-semialdehyde dehydrogenase